jgi:hypothetical protein
MVSILRRSTCMEISNLWCGMCDFLWRLTVKGMFSVAYVDGELIDGDLDQK